MKSLYTKDKIKFTGEQLEAHWTFNRFDLLGDSILAFVGPCEVDERYLIGADHFKKKTQVKSEMMLHFLVEHFDQDLEKAILRQKLLMSILKDKLNHRLGGDVFQRWGNDIFEQDFKLTVSTVTKTPVSTKIHVGINVSAKNVPVKAKGLSDYGIDPDDIAEVVMNQYRLDMRRIKERMARTRSVGS